MNEDKASRYHRLKRRSAVALTAITVVGLAVLLAGGSLRVRDVASVISGEDAFAPSTVAIYVLLVMAAYQAARAPNTNVAAAVSRGRATTALAHAASHVPMCCAIPLAPGGEPGAEAEENARQG